MEQERTNHLMTLHVHNDSIDSVDLVEVANQFVCRNEYFCFSVGFAQMYKYSDYL